MLDDQLEEADDAGQGTVTVCDGFHMVSAKSVTCAQSSDDMEDVLDISTENMAHLKEEAQMIDDDTLIRYIRVFSELIESD